MSDALETEELTLATLELVGDMPGMMGRLRAARVVGGYDIGDEPELDRYAVATTWTLAPLVDLIDALLDGGLLAQTPGARPTLVLTRAGHRALDALADGESLGGIATIAT